MTDAEKPKNKHAVALSKKGASKGGIARALKLTAEERSASAQKAAQARWGQRTVELQAERDKLEKRIASEHALLAKLPDHTDGCSPLHPCIACITRRSIATLEAQRQT